MICFQISIFEPLETTGSGSISNMIQLWFAFKLVSLNHWKQLWVTRPLHSRVVICFQISIFEPLETTTEQTTTSSVELWFAFKLVSLNHWKQRRERQKDSYLVVICFQISIFEPLETTVRIFLCYFMLLWFAFKLVSLNHWKQHCNPIRGLTRSCDLLSN